MKSKDKLNLFDSIDLILWEVWDPIGINDDIQARDEYRGYVPSVMQLLCNEVDVFRLTQHLRNLEQVNMGLSTQIIDPRRTTTANTLLDAYCQHKR